MLAEIKPSYAFLVVTYNHQEYILEHLESIKYLVQTYGTGIDVDLIVNDDCSRDQTCTLVDSWLGCNARLFRNVKIIYNSKNLGTCASVNNMLTHMKADRCKMTAGDDVYSFENIFDLTQCEPNNALVSGRVFHLFGDELKFDRFANILATATQSIYRKDALLHRFKHFSYNNAPNILYEKECLLHPQVREYLQRFDVVEDWPLQVAIARQFPERNFRLIDKVLVYYRRTLGSTYIVANQRFIGDKLAIYNDLIKNEESWLERIRLRSRKFCFVSQNWWINKLLNLDFYFYIVAFVCAIFEIKKNEKKLVIDIRRHSRHYSEIKEKAQLNKMKAT